jgi:NADH dehydrogenase
VAYNIVIAGGGFGGLYAARTLERVLPQHSARITLVNDVNFMLFTPLLPGAAGGTLDPRHVVVPLREELKRTELRLGRVTGADPDRHELHVETIDGVQRALHYDQLIVALGSVSRTFPVPGLVEHGIGFKTIAEAIALRNRLIRMLETAEVLDDEDKRRAHLGFVFVGGGYSGLEGLAELQDLAADILDNYPRCRQTGMRFVLVEARERVMMEVTPSLSEFTVRELRGRGIEFRTNTTVTEVTEDTVTLSDGDVIDARTLVWTAGVKPHPVVAELGLPLEQSGRIKVDQEMRVDGRQNVWAIGDAAAVPDPARKGQESPPTAQHALRQGRVVARNVAATLGTGRTRKFKYKTLGVFVDLGRHEAVAETVGIRWRGFPAWFLARSYHLVAMPGIKRRMRLVVDWTVDLVFPRDASELGQLGHRVELDSELGARSAGGTPVHPDEDDVPAVAAAVGAPGVESD